VAGFWASELAEELSQGDLLAGAWVGCTIHPRTALKKVTGKHGATLWHEASSLVPGTDGKAPYLSRGQQALTLVLSQSCEIDKKGGKLPVLLAPVLPLSNLPSQMQENVRAARRHAFLHVPAVGSVPESYCDLRAICFVPRPVVDELGRIASTSEEGELRIAAQVMMFLFRRDIGPLVSVGE